MIDLPSVGFEYSLVCDDVRREENGKFIFIGVYANNILLSEFPSVIRFRIVMRMHPRRSLFPLGIRVKMDDEPLLIFRGTVASETLEPETSPSPELHVQIKGPGTLRVEVSDEEFEASDANPSQWTHLYSIPVGQM